MLGRSQRASGWSMAILGLLFFGALFFIPYVEGDTWALLDDADGLLRCLGEHRYLGCAEAGKYPPFQLLIAVPLRALGISHEHVGRLLAWGGTVAFAGTLFVVWTTLRARSQWVAWSAVLILVTGLPLHYATHSYAEVPGVFFTAWFASSWVRGRNGSLAMAALLASLTKETAAPFLALLGVICAVISEPAAGSYGSPSFPAGDAPGRRRELPRLALTAIMLAAGVGVCLALNVFRFRGLFNAQYLSEMSWGPSLGQQLLNWLALWIAPNAGLLFFFPGFIAAFAVLPFAVPRAKARGAHLSWYPFVLLLLLLLALTGSLARWWAPFGWAAWGQRLSLPFLPASLMLLAYAYAEAYEPMLHYLVANRARVTGLVAVLVVLGIPEVVSLTRGAAIVHDFFVYRGGCEEPAFDKTRAEAYRCLARQTWSDPAPRLRAYRDLSDRRAWPWALAYAALLASVGAYLGMKASPRNPEGNRPVGF